MAHSYSPPLSSEFKREITGITSLGDVHINPPLNNGDILVYNSTTQNFNNVPQSSTTLAFNDLTDVAVSKTIGVDGYAVVYDNASGNFVQRSGLIANSGFNGESVLSSSAGVARVRCSGNGLGVAIESTGVGNTIVLRPDADASSRVIISELNKTPATYASHIANHPEAVPNKYYVDTVAPSGGDVFNYVLNASLPTSGSSNGLLYFNPVGLIVGNSVLVRMTLETLNDKFIQQYIETLIVNDLVIIRKKTDPNTFLRGLITIPPDVIISGPPPTGYADITFQIFGLNGTFVANDALEFIITDRSLPLWTGSDVDSTTVQSATTGQVLMWNDTTNKWEAQYVPVPAVALNDLTDVAITSVANGNILQYNGTNWVNIAPAPTTAIYEYTVDTSVVAPPIATAKIVYNNATQTSSTVIYLSHITDLAQDIENFLSLYTAGTKITIQDKTTSGNYQNFEMTGTPTVSPATHVSFPVNFLSAGGTGITNFANNLKTVVVFTATSASGASANSFREDTFLYTYAASNPLPSSSGGQVHYTAVGPFSDTLAFTFQDADGNNIKNFLNAVNTSLAKGTVWGLKKKTDVNTFVFFAVLSAVATQSAPDPAGRIIFTGTTLASNGTFTVGDSCELYINRVADFITALADFDYLASDYTDKATIIFDSATSKFKTVSRSNFFTNTQLSGTTTIQGLVESYTLPDNDGVANQVLRTDGAGATYWESLVPESTGVLTGGLLTVNGADNTKFDISDGTGYIIFGGDVKKISWTGKTALTPTGATGNLTFVLLDQNTNPVYSATRPTNTQIRDNIFLGALVHTALPVIDTTNDQQSIIAQPANQLHDLMEAVGFLNVSGNVVSAASTNLTLAKSVGKMFAAGSNYKNAGANDPHLIELPAINTNTGGGTFPNIFQYRARNGTSSALTLTTVLPSNYDNGTNYPGTTVPTNNWTVQRIYSFTSNRLKIQMGQETYANSTTALNAISTQSFTTEPSIASNGMLIAYMVIKESATNLADTSQCIFVQAGKFGTAGGVSAGGGGGGSTFSMVLSNPYPIHRIGANITPATTQYYLNANANFTGLATSIRFILGSAGGDNFRLGIYRANTAWDIATAVLIGQTAVTAATGLATDTIHSLPLVAEVGQNLSLTAGECIILCCYFDGTVASWKGSTITSSTVAWQNTTNLTAPLLNFPTNPAAKATNSGTVPFIDLIGTTV